MFKAITTSSLFLLLVSGAVFPAAAAPSNASQMASLQFMVGTWHCTNAMGGMTLTETETIVAQNPQWLHGSGTMILNGRSLSEDFYIGYDAQHAQWVLVSVDSSGNYGVSTSATPALSPSSWIAAYPASDGKGVFTSASANQYSVDSNWTQNGHAMSSHEVCTKA